MKKKKKQITGIGLLVFFVLCIATLEARDALIKTVISKKKIQAEDTLGYYNEMIASKLMYEYNFAKGIAASIASDPGDVNVFQEAADVVLQSGDVSYISLIEGNTVICALPKEQYGSQTGSTLRDFPYVFNMPGLLRETVIEGPKDFFETDQEAFLYLEPIIKEGEYWGQVAVCLNKEKVVDSFHLDKLAKNGYEYELWKIDFQDGNKEIVSVTDASFDYSDSMTLRLELRGQWTLNIMPRQGWLDPKERQQITIVCLLAGMLLTGAIFWFLRAWWLSYCKKMQEYVDSQSGMFSRTGFEQEVNAWIKKKPAQIAILYFVVQDYNHITQTVSGEEQKAYLDKIQRGIANFIEHAYVAARIGEGNFCIAVLDDMSENEISDLAKGLCIEMIWKTNAGKKKEFLNVGYQYVTYPKDGINAAQLLEKVTGDYYVRIEQESPVVSLTEKCMQLIQGKEQVVFEEYSDRYMLRLSKAIHQYSKKVGQLAYQDAVYHIGNRSKYLRDAQMLISYDKKRKFTLFCIDICSFSKYNELFSVEIGDEILHEVSRRLQVVFGDYLYRINGDVFLGILLGEELVLNVWMKIYSSLIKPVQIGKVKLVLDAKCGVCAYPVHGKTPKSLLEGVHTALRYAKEQEDQKIMVYSEMLSKALRREVDILKLLESGIEKGTLEVWYQPIWDLHQKCFRMAEALIRLKDEGGSYLSPMEVVQIAEKNRVVDRIGGYVLKDVCEFLKAHQQQLGFDRISLNLSVQELLTDGSVERILQQIHEAGVEPDSISMEITETILIQSLDKICPVLLKLQTAGIRIVLDDFGTGYSSLNYLSNLPVDMLKVDCELTHQIMNSRKQFALLKAIVEMAKVNDILVVVEGVETEEERDMIEQTGADYIQGYFYAKPLQKSQLFAKVQDFQKHN